MRDIQCDMSMDEEENSFDLGPNGRETNDVCMDEEYTEKEIKKEIPSDFDENDYNLVTIENVSLEVLTKRISQVMMEIAKRGLRNADFLFDIALQVLHKSTITETDNEDNPVINLIINGMLHVILKTEPRDDNCVKCEKAVIMFVGKLAVVAKSQKCAELLDKLIGIINNFYCHNEINVRQRLCNLINILFLEAGNIEEAEKEAGDDAYLFDDDEPEPSCEIIPSGIKEQWVKKLVMSVLDKSPPVRASAVFALSKVDYDIVVEENSENVVTVNDVISRSMHDIDENVRFNAVRCVHIVKEVDIDRCIDFVECCTENKIRYSMVVRLSTDVHLLSFTEKQRYRLLEVLMSSESVRVHDAIQQHLVESWMNNVSDELLCLSLFETTSNLVSITDLDANLLLGFPSLILEYLNPITKPNVTSHFLKFCIRRYFYTVYKSNCNDFPVDLDLFLTNVIVMSESQCENLGLMRRSTFKLLFEEEMPSEEEEELWLKKTYYRIFFSRFLIDIIFEMTRRHSDVRDKAFRNLFPGTVQLCDEIEIFCHKYLNKKTDEESTQLLESTLMNMFQILNRIIENNDDRLDRDSYAKLLDNLLENPLLKLSNEIVVLMVTLRLDLCGKDELQISETCDWMCHTANRIVMSKEDGSILEVELQEALNFGLNSNEMLRRCTAMLLGLCQYEEIKECSVNMSTLFSTLVPALLANDEKAIQIEGIQLIGYTAVIDFENCQAHLKLIQYLMISQDDDILKATSFNTLIKVIKKHGFPKVAEAIYGDETEESEEQQKMLAKFFLRESRELKGIAMVQVVRDFISMISYGYYFWPKLLSFVMRIAFSKEYHPYKLSRFFRKFCRVSVVSTRNKIHLMRSFIHCIDKCTTMSESDCDVRIGDLTSFICEHLSNMTTVENGMNEDEAPRDEDFFVEAELCRRIARHVHSNPQIWTVKHIFTAFSTNLYLDCVPLYQLDNIHDILIDTLDQVRFIGSKCAHLAVKRFVNSVEKAIGMKETFMGSKNKGMKEVKKEVMEPVNNSRNNKRKTTDEVSNGNEKRTKKSSSTSVVNEWDHEGMDTEEESQTVDDSFDYVPKPTKSRNKKKVTFKDTPSISFIEDNVKEEDDDSFDNIDFS